MNTDQQKLLQEINNINEISDQRRVADVSRRVQFLARLGQSSETSNTAILLAAKVKGLI